jgi:hypothetical protein
MKFPFQIRDQSLPGLPYLKRTRRIFFKEVSGLLQPHSFSDLLFKKERTFSRLTQEFQYDEESDDLFKLQRELKRRGFTPVLHDQGSTPWISVEKSFEARGLKFRISLDYMIKTDRARFRASVRFADAPF